MGQSYRDSSPCEVSQYSLLNLTGKHPRITAFISGVHLGVDRAGADAVVAGYRVAVDAGAAVVAGAAVEVIKVDHLEFIYKN